MKENGHFSRLPAAAVFDPKVTAKTLRVLAALGTYADKQGMCWPSMATLAKRLRLSRAGVRYHLKKLEKLGYIYVERRRKGNKSNEVNRYQLVYPEAHSTPVHDSNAEDDEMVFSIELNIGSDVHCPCGQVSPDTNSPIYQPTPTDCLQEEDL